MMVKFATTCDALTEGGKPCGRRSPEYESWPDCRECMDDICPDHAAPGSFREGERDRSYGDYTEAEHWESVLCLTCAADMAEEEK